MSTNRAQPTLLLSVLAALLASCAPLRSPPALSTIDQAPESIREAISLIEQESGPPSIHYNLQITHPDGWIDLQPIYEDDMLFIKGSFAYGDDDPFTIIERIRVDTGADGFFSIPLGHERADGVWLSAELGQRASTTLTGTMRSWIGFGSGLGIEMVNVFPIPLTVSEVSDPHLAQSPVLGQTWFERANAVWIDPEGEALAVSFEPDAISRLVEPHPEYWVTLPWRAAKPNGHRFVPITIAGQPYEAVVDTGAQGLLFLDTPHPPRFVGKPWGRGPLHTGARRGTVFEATSSEALHLGTLAIENIKVLWSPRSMAAPPQTPQGHPLAILGIPLLRQHPVLLDPTNDRAYFFIGDRADLPALLD